MKPESIRKFDLLYLASQAVALVSFALLYPAISKGVEARLAEAGPDGAGLGLGIVLGGLVFSLLIALALWFLISVLRIELVKWVLILFAAWSVYSLRLTLADGINISDLVSYLGTLMSIMAIWFLFKPDAKAWFAEKRK
ncbi:MAG: hypothetical protein WC692_02580 [Erythrobacter sp.]|jgi:hypothetical protein